MLGLDSSSDKSLKMNPKMFNLCVILISVADADSRQNSAMVCSRPLNQGYNKRCRLTLDKGLIWTSESLYAIAHIYQTLSTDILALIIKT